MVFNQMGKFEEETSAFIDMNINMITSMPCPQIKLRCGASYVISCATAPVSFLILSGSGVEGLRD